jgi:hypothetical protein
MTPQKSSRSFWPSTLILVLFLVSQGNLALIIGPLSPSFFAMQFAFTPERYVEILQAWGPDGIARYRSHFAYDLLHPLLFGAFGWVSVRTSPLFEGMSTFQERFFRWHLPLAAAFDYIENSCQLRLLSVPSGTENWLIPVSATCATIKWTLAALFLTGLLRQLIAWTLTPAKRV